MEVIACNVLGLLSCDYNLKNENSVLIYLLLMAMERRAKFCSP